MTHPTTAGLARVSRALFASGLGFALASCGGRPPLQPETWMIGTFSSRGLEGCSSADSLERFVLSEDGRVDIIKDSASDAADRQWVAQWIQTGEGVFRILPDEDHSAVEFYPISEGEEWECTRSFECDEWGLVSHVCESVDLATGERNGAALLIPGAICVASDAGTCGDFKHEVCQGYSGPWSECD